MKETLSVGLALFAASFIACEQKPAPYPAYCTDETAFTAALVRCVDKSNTKAASRECRKDVHAKCGLVEKVSER